MTREELDALYFEGLKAEEEGEFDKAMQLFLRGAANGDDSAMNAIGLFYDCGKGVEQDKSKAIEWFKKAYRNKKQIYFCGNIALTYAEIGNRRQAIHWWQKAVSHKDGEAALDLAKYLMKSKQVLDLLQMAANCEAPLDISPSGKEQTEDLLAILTRKGYD